MKTATGTIVVVNGQIVDGTGAAPVPDAVVVIDEGRIRYAGPVGQAPPYAPGTPQIDALGGTIMPRLVEAHFLSSQHRPRGGVRPVPAGDRRPQGERS